MHRAPGLLSVLVLAACGGGKPGGQAAADTAVLVSAAPAPTPEDATLRLIITSDPAVYANGHAVSPHELDSALAAVPDSDGEVWLYREVADPHVGAAQDSLADLVLAAITRHNLPLKVSRKPDFSDQTGKHRRPSPDSP
jgi:hypothetical protein